MPKRPTNLIFAMLLLFCGQLVAAPLLSCCSHAGEPGHASSSHAMPMHEMPMHEMQAMHEMATHGGHAEKVGDSVHTSMVDTSMVDTSMVDTTMVDTKDAMSAATAYDSDCDHNCNYCLVLASVPVLQTQRAMPMSLQINDYPQPRQFIPQAPSDAHFRPPNLA